MTTAARIAVLPAGPGPLRIDDVVLPDPGPRQVVVRQFASGVCHSQLHQMHGPRQAPTVLGHESTGVVLAAGREVSHVGEGDRVMVTWVPRRPEEAGRSPESARLPLPDGTTAVSQNVFTWADHTIADEQFVVALPDDVKTDVTSIIGCAVMTGAGAVRNTAGVRRGESVAVFGVGGVGLSAVVAARVVGADPIIAVDLRDDKLEMARRFGATETVNASAGDAVARVRELTADPNLVDMLGRPVGGVDYAFDCIGVKATMEQIVPAARSGVLGAARGGAGVLVGVPRGSVELNAIDMLVNEKRFVASLGGSCQPERDFPVFLDWYRDGRLDLDALVTARYALEDINEATTDLEEGRIFGRSILVFD
ncbi:MAG TPA: zinc-binding dehydrogenase [Acidimicrobiales bacterium]